MEKIYYCVTSAYHDNGRVIAAITLTRKCRIKPANHTTQAYDRDIYMEWYGSLKEAQKAVAEARAESSER